MNLKSNIVARTFSKEEIERLKILLVDGEELLKLVVKILENRYMDTLPTEKDFDKENYGFRRAFLDGRGAEISWTIKFFEEE